MGALSQDRARKLALMNAAAAIKDMALDQLFGEELLDAAAGDKAVETTLDEAKKYAVQQIMNLVQG